MMSIGIVFICLSVFVFYGCIVRHCSFTSFDTSQNVDLKIFAFHNLNEDTSLLN